MVGQKKQKVTIGTFDLVKGIGMIVIVWGHTFSGCWTDMPYMTLAVRLFGAGIMPMFYLASGYGSREADWKKTMKKSAKELLRPYLLVTAAVAVLFPVFHYLAFWWWPGAFSEMLSVTLSFLTGSSRSGRTFLGIRLYECGVVWFLLSLFWAVNLTNLILKLHSRVLETALSLLCVVLGYVCMVGGFWYFCIPQGLMAVGYLYAGYCIKKSKWLTKEIPALQRGVLLPFFVLEMVYGNVNFAYGILRLGLLDWAGAGCMGVLLLRFSLWANRFDNALLEGIRKIGRYSYYAMLVHSVEISCIPWYLLQQRFEACPYAGYTVQLLLRVVLLTAGCMVLKKVSISGRKGMKIHG